MASLYDLELQESNNFIHCLMADGKPLSLNLMEEQVQSFKNMGAAGEEILKQMEDPESDMGKNLARIREIYKALTKVMKDSGLTSEMAKKANDVLTKNPNSLNDLSDPEKASVRDYWLKKKTIINEMFRLGFTAEELFA